MQGGPGKRRARNDRGAWPVRIHPLGEGPGDDLSGETTAEERLDMMWPLALEAWALAGWSIPDYARSAAPVARRPWAARP